MEQSPQPHPSTTYRYIPAISAYSSGVAVERGYRLIELRLPRDTSLEAGLRLADREIERRELSPTALVGVQLRSPAVMSTASFAAFNELYLGLLDERGLLLDGNSPLSRTNVVPQFGAPAEPVLYSAFVVVPDGEADGHDFVVAGSGEAQGGLAPENIVAYADISQHGLRAKTELVLAIMAERLAALGHDVSDPTSVNVYTAHDVAGLQTLVAARLSAANWAGFVSYPSRPPVDHIEFEMDCSRVSEVTYLREA